MEKYVELNFDGDDWRDECDDLFMCDYVGNEAGVENWPDSPKEGDTLNLVFSRKNPGPHAVQIKVIRWNFVFVEGYPDATITYRAFSNFLATELKMDEGDICYGWVDMD